MPVQQSAKVHVTLDDLVKLQFDQHRFSFLPNQPIHSLLSGRHASRLRGRGLLFEELRRYRPGDDIRSIDWRATARMKKAHIRVYSEERERTVLLVVDQRNSMHFGSRRATKAVAACELAALGAWHVLKAKDRIGAIIFNDEETVVVKPHRSRANVHRICSELVRMNQKLDIHSNEENSSALNEAMDKASALAKHDVLVVLATDCFGADDETNRIATRIAKHNDMLACLTYDPMGIRLPVGSGLSVSDGKNTVQLPDNSKFQKDYEAQFVEWGQLIRSRFQSLKIPVLPICTHDPVVDQVLQALGYAP